MHPDLRGYRTFQALILGALGVFLLARIGDGGILRYINQRFILLVAAGALALLLLAQVLLQARPAAGQADNPQHAHENRRGWHLWLLALPLLIGLLVPQRPLGASAAGLRGLGTLGAPAGADALALPPGQRDVLEWIRALEGAADPSALSGQPADVIGFVYRDGRTPAGSFYVARFSITCCAADAAAFGIQVDWDGSSPANDAWVRVRGPVEVLSAGDRPRLLLQARSVELVPEPVQPYLFP
jgi:putative membrane protein